MKRTLLFALVALAGCGPKASPTTVATTAATPTTPAPAETRRPPAGLALDEAATGFWEEALRHAPTWATNLGDRSRDGQLEDASETEHLRHRQALTGFRERLATVDRAALSAGERITADVLEYEISSTLDVDDACSNHQWVVDPLAGPQVTYAELPNFHSLRTPEDVHTLSARYRGMRRYYQDHVANLRAGLGKGLISPAVPVKRVVQSLDDQLRQAPEASAYVTAAVIPADWPAADRAAAQAELLLAVKEGVRPGLTAYRDFLRNELLPRARKDVGVSALPGGPACYAARIRRYTGTTRTPDELHALGLSEVARIEAAMANLVKKAGGKDVPAYFETLKKDRAQYAKDPEAILEWNRRLVERATAALPGAFGSLPRTPIEVKALEPFRERDSPAGYYYEAPSDGSRKAVYYVNTYRPAERPLYQMASLAFHEAVPGHHLQIAIANENLAVPEFQRHLGQDSFVEGWALYSEGLASELGLYENDAEKLGALGAEMWRAARLVVDTGMHAKGWSREKALAYMEQKTGRGGSDTANEIDRYITWPGQALAYKVGEKEIRSMRASAEAALGARFSLSKFHDRLLSHGAVPLPTARRDIEVWIAEEQRTVAR